MNHDLEIRKWVTRRTVVGLILSLCILLAAGISFIYPAQEKTPGDILAEAGYLEMIPPSNFHGPGTINTIESLDGGSIQLHPTCEWDSEALAELQRESRTTDRTISERLGNKFDARIQIAEILGGKISASKIKTADLRFENVKIFLMTHETLFKLRESIKGSCEKAIIINLNAGARVCQSEAVLQADVVYSIEFEDEVEVVQKNKMIKKIAQILNLNSESSMDQKIRGNALYYGIKLMRRSLTVNAGGQTPPECTTEGT